jgi:hypothetical protein
MALERFDGIRGTTGIITARRRKQMTERHLVAPHTENEECPHQVSFGAICGPGSVVRSLGD